MLILSLGGIDVSDYVSDYTVNKTVKEISAGKSSSGSDTFVNWDGTVINAAGEEVGYDVAVTEFSAVLSKVPRGLAENISEAVTKKKENETAITFDAGFASPSVSGGQFKLKSYSASSRRFAETWDISISATSDLGKSGEGAAVGGL